MCVFKELGVRELKPGEALELRVPKKLIKTKKGGK